MYIGAHERRALRFEQLCVYDIYKNIILYKVFAIGQIHFVCAIRAFACTVLKKRGKKRF